MQSLIVSLTLAFAACTSAPPQDADPSARESKAQASAMMKAQEAEMLARLAELQALKADADGAIVVRRAVEAVAGMPLDEAAMEDAPYAGLRLSDLAPETAAQLPIMPGSGLLISDVVADGPAAGAGLKAMDVIAKVGDQVIVNADQFRVLVRARKVGEAMPVTIFRGGKEMTVTFPLGVRKQPKLGPGGRIAGAGFETDGDVMVMNADRAIAMQRYRAGLAPDPNYADPARAMQRWRAGQAPDPRIVTMHGPNGEVTVTVNSEAQAVSAGNAATPPVAAASPVTAASPVRGAATTSRTVSKEVYTDEHAEITWTTTNGVDAVVIKDVGTGKVVWEGAGAPDAAALGALGDDVRGSVQRMLEGRAAAKARSKAQESMVPPLPPATPARPNPGEASAPSAADA